nr:NAD(P)H-hydrate dehydratase [bacterium]
MKIVTRQGMRALEKQTAAMGMAECVMMERAALAMLPHALKLAAGGGIDIYCGPGNNGGDGLALARLLHQAGAPVRAAIVQSGPVGAACAAQMQLAQALGASIALVESQEQLSAWAGNSRAALRVDALLGIGLTRPVEGLLLSAVRSLQRPGAQVMAVDIPSGIDCDNGQVLGDAAACRMTVTFQHAKCGHLLYPGRALCGEVVVADIGLCAAGDTAFAIDEAEVQARLPRRPALAHKGTFGSAGLVAGSPGMPGAAALMAQGASRGGAGLTYLYGPVLPAACPPEVMWQNADQIEITAFFQGKTAIGLGPGLGREEYVRTWVELALDEPRVPVLLDADALNAIADTPGILRRAAGRLVITPHPGEFARLSGVTAAQAASRPLEHAQKLAEALGIVVLLKGATTVIARPDGPAALHAGGNPGMATGGSGDVLSGVIVALMAQGLSPFDAAVCGAWLHGQAGDAAARARGMGAMRAGDIAEHLHF